MVLAERMPQQVDSVQCSATATGDRSCLAALIDNAQTTRFTHHMSMSRAEKGSRAVLGAGRHTAGPRD